MQGEFGSCCHGEEIGLISNGTERDLVTVHMMAGRGDRVCCRSSFISARAELTEANWLPFPQHDLVLNLRAHPEGVGASPADSASAIFFLFKRCFLQKWLIKTTWLTSELEE